MHISYAVICGRFSITVNWDYLNAQNQGKLANVCLQQFLSIFKSTIYTYAKHIWHAFIVFHKLTKNVIFGSKGGPTFSRGGGRTQLLIPYRTCDFQGESGPPVTPTSSLGLCMTDPLQNDLVSCLNHELSLVCIALIFVLQK